MHTDYRKILALAAEGSWHEAHEAVQTDDSDIACRIHAYLHRVEGDRNNARYWYQRCGMEMPANTLGQEFAVLEALVAFT